MHTDGTAVSARDYSGKGSSELFLAGFVSKMPNVYGGAVEKLPELPKWVHVDLWVGVGCGCEKRIMSNAKGTKETRRGWSLHEGEVAGVPTPCPLQGGDQKKSGGGTVNHGETRLTTANDVLNFLGMENRTTIYGGVGEAVGVVQWGLTGLGVRGSVARTLAQRRNLLP